MKKIMLIYQDCPLCGARKEWGEQQTNIADTHGFEIINTPFYRTGVRGLIMKALESGIGRMPFFTDGEKFSYDLEDFVEKPKRIRRKKQAQNEDTVQETEDKDGASTES